MRRKRRRPCARSPIDRRRVILAGSALAAAPPCRIRPPRRPGLAPAADLLAATRRFLDSLEPEKRKAASFAWDGSGVAQLELFRRRRLHQAGPAARTDERRAEGSRLGPARDAVLAGRHREDPQRHDVAGCAGGERQRRRAALVAALLVRGLRHAGRDRRLGLPARRPSSDPVDQRARRPHRLGDAVVVLGAARAHHVGQACGTDDAEGRGGAGAASRRRSRRQAARAPVGLAALQHHVLCGTRAVEHPEGRHRGRRHDRRRSATCCGNWSRPIRCSTSSPALAAAQKDRVRAGDREAVHFAWYGPNRPRRRSAIG